jgi:tetratricopeptide (TPR) repeat protein
VVGSALVLAGLSLGALAARRARPYLLVGWLWYLVTLVPVIGLVQAGEQAMADRFTYVPLLGIFVAVAWALPPLAALVPAAIAAAAAYALVTRAQLPVWKDATTVFGHAVAVDPRNAVAHVNLAVALVERGELDAASQHYEASGAPPAGVRARRERVRERRAGGRPSRPGGRALRGGRSRAARRRGRPQQPRPHRRPARGHRRRARLVRGGGARRPAEHRRPEQLGALLVAAGRPEEGLASIDRALAIRRDNGRAWANRALALLALQRSSEAWQAVAQARTLGTEPAPNVLAALRRQMPEPAAP